MLYGYFQLSWCICHCTCCCTFCTCHHKCACHLNKNVHYILLHSDIFVMSTFVQPILHASGNRDSVMQICRFVCTGKFKSVKIFDHICMHICEHICMQICKPIRCKSVSYLYHILKGIEYISVQTSSISGSCPDCVLIQGFKMWSKLPTYPEWEGTSS